MHEWDSELLLKNTKVNVLIKIFAQHAFIQVMTNS